MLWVFLSSKTPGKPAFTTRVGKLSNVERRQTFPGVFAVPERIPFIIPFAAIQAARLLTSGLNFGLVGRDHHSSWLTLGHEMTQGADGRFLLEPMLIMVISHWQNHGSVAGA